MRYKLLGCKVLQRELCSLMVHCPNTIDLTTIQQDLHNRPQMLRQVLQSEIDAIDAARDIHTNDLTTKPVDAILLAYGLCSNAVVGLHSRHNTLVIPRTHDCIGMLMGSRERYNAYFSTHPGTYYWTQGWYECGADLSDRVLQQRYAEYLEKYGDDMETVEYLMDMEREILRHYNRLCLIHWDTVPAETALQQANETARQKNWELEVLQGQDTLLKKLLWGDWQESDFLIVPPGGQIQPSWNEAVMKSGPKNP